MESLNTFWQLVSRYRIEIPVFQRDYAQGRSTAKATQIRKGFVKSLLEALNSKEAMQLQFIYGRINNGIFIPVDGQQRLTTLFLLHLYLALFCPDANNCPNCHYLDTLRNFTYTTRQSSREFCEAITDINKINKAFSVTENNQTRRLTLDKIPNQDLEKFIKNQPWFFANWCKDPTIRGMLRTLQEIHHQIPAEKLKDFRKILFEEMPVNEEYLPIQFSFLDMGEHSLTDDLYLKMNSRGLPLDSFDIFKTQFEEYLEKFQQDLTEKGYDKNVIFLTKPDKINEKVWNETAFHKRVTMKFDLEWYDKLWRIYGPKGLNDDNNSTAFAEVPQRLLGVITRVFRYFCIIRSDIPARSTRKEVLKNKKLSNEYQRILKGLSNDYQKRFNMSLEKIFSGQECGNLNLGTLLDDLHKERLKPLVEIAKKPESYIDFTPFKIILDSFDNPNDKILLLKSLFIFLDNLKLMKCKCSLPSNNEEEQISLMNELNSLDNSEQSPIRTWAVWMRNFDLLDIKMDSQQDFIIAAIAFFGRTIKDNEQEFYDWLRFAWNVTEDNSNNETVLLRLWEIRNKAWNSEKGILQYLADDIKNIKQENGVAQKQIEEECEKAKIIIKQCDNHFNRDKQWYCSIMEAERFAFFHGCIRFLFRNAQNEPEWELLFHKKFERAKELFDSKGVKGNNDANKFELVRTLLKLCTDNNQLFEHTCIFNIDSSNWKTILTNELWRQPIDHILQGNILPVESYKSSQSAHLNSYWDDIPLTKAQNYRFKQDSNGGFDFYPLYARDGITFDNPGIWERNITLLELKENGKISIINDIWNGKFIFGWHVDFIYNGEKYTWHGNSNIYNGEGKLIKSGIHLKKDFESFLSSISNPSI